MTKTQSTNPVAEFLQDLLDGLSNNPAIEYSKVPEKIRQISSKGNGEVQKVTPASGMVPFSNGGR